MKLFWHEDLSKYSTILFSDDQGPVFLKHCTLKMPLEPLYAIQRTATLDLNVDEYMPH